MLWQPKNESLEKINAGNMFTTKNGPTEEVFNAIVQTLYFLKEEMNNGNTMASKS